MCPSPPLPSRKRWRVEFESGAVEFNSIIADEAFARRWARKAKGVPEHERITKVTSIELPLRD